MKYNYYTLDSTSFSNVEDVVNALNEGETIFNDDAYIRFFRDRWDRLVVRDSYIDENNPPFTWTYVHNIDFNNAKGVISVMDSFVEKCK